MNENKLTFKKIINTIIMLFVMLFIPMIISIIISSLNGRPRNINYVIMQYTGELLMLIILIPYLPKRDEKAYSEQAKQHKHIEKQ